MPSSGRVCRSWARRGAWDPGRGWGPCRTPGPCRRPGPWRVPRDPAPDLRISPRALDGRSRSTPSCNVGWTKRGGRPRTTRCTSREPGRRRLAARPGPSGSSAERQGSMTAERPAGGLAPPASLERTTAVGGVRQVPVPDAVARDYLLLGLRLDQHVPGTVDGYFGPAELKARADMEQLRSPARLAEDAVALGSRLANEVPEDAARRHWLELQLIALETLA